MPVLPFKRVNSGQFNVGNINDGSKRCVVNFYSRKYLSEHFWKEHKLREGDKLVRKCLENDCRNLLKDRPHRQMKGKKVI